MRKRLMIAATVTALTLVTAGLTFLAQERTSAQPVPRAASARGALFPAEQSLITLFESARPSVVYITTQQQVIDTWTRNVMSIPRGSGSGFVWDDRGHLVTNNHVVAGASSARVRLADGRDVAATLVGVSPAHDLAVLRLNVTNPPRPLPIGTTADLRVGQTALAIGNPFGLDWSLTTGVISALDRSLPAEDGRTLIEHLIQTDAAINPGNSGGPLLDSAGRVMGVNTLIYSPSGAWAGVGFAIPIDTVNRVVPQLIARGRYVRPALGIQADERLNALIMQQTGQPGVAVLGVTRGSGAEAAGLRPVRESGGQVVPGDIIVAVNGTPVDSVARLLGRLDELAVGDTVRLTIIRDERRMDVNVRLQAGAE